MPHLPELSHRSLPLLLSLAAAGLLIAYFANRLFSSPLRGIPGPLLCKLIPGWIAYHAFRDTLQEAVLQAHEKYGDVVCVSPNTVLARTPEAITKVLGYASNHLAKSSDYGALVFHTPSVFSEIDKQVHTRKRRIAAQAYSMNNIAKMEGLISSNVDRFLQVFETYASSGKPIDLCQWFRYYAFDVIGDLAFGETFGMLARGSEGEFASQISEGIEYTFVLFLLPPFLRPLRRFLARWRLPGLAGSTAGFEYVREKTRSLVYSRWNKFIEEGRDGRPDILSALLDAKDLETGDSIKLPDLATNASTNVVAGSDTLTIALTLDTAISNKTLAVKDVLVLPYLDACVKEAMRLNAPFGGPMPRVSPIGGVEIAKQHIPEGAIICVMHDAVHLDERVFHQPSIFNPDRWLLDKTEDMERCFVGFSTGPRSCLGRNIALLEMKMLLIQLLTRYELTLAEPQVELSCRRYLVTKSLQPIMARVARREEPQVEK